MTAAGVAIDSRRRRSLGDDGAPLPTRTRPGGEQIQFVHLLRGLAAMMVLWSHLSGYWLYENQRGWVIQDLWAKHIVIPFHLYQNAGHLGVILFFLISGYIITFASMRENAVQFLIKRVLRIFPLLAVAIGLSALVMRLNESQEWSVLPGLMPASIPNYIGAVFLVDQFTGTDYVLGPTWTLAIEVLFYALVCVTMSVRRLGPRRSTWAMLAFWALGTAAVLTVPPLNHLAPTFVYLAFLLGGRVVFLIQRGLVERASGAIALASIATLFLLFYTVAFPGQLMIPSVEPLVTYVLAVLIFAAMLRAPIRRVAQPFRFFGDASYSIYVLHIPVGMITINAAVAAGAPFSVAFASGTVATLVAAFITNRLVERPSQRLARQLARRLASPSEPEPVSPRAPARSA